LLFLRNKQGINYCQNKPQSRQIEQAQQQIKPSCTKHQPDKRPNLSSKFNFISEQGKCNGYKRKDRWNYAYYLELALFQREKDNNIEWEGKNSDKKNASIRDSII